MTTAEKFNKENTIYKIVHDIDLEGETLTIPSGCTLDFQGGSFSNGTIVGNNTKIMSGALKIFDANVILNGTWKVENWYPEWFKVDSNSWSESITTAIDNATKFTGNVRLISKYSISKPIIIDRKVDGNEYNSYLIIYGGEIETTSAISIFTSSYEYSNTPNTQHVEFNSITFSGVTGSTVLDGNKILRSRFVSCNFHIQCLISNYYIQQLYFTNCLMRDYSGTFMICNAGCFDIKFVQCSIDRSLNREYGGFEFYSTSYRISNLSFTDCIISGVKFGIKYSGANSMSITGCFLFL